MVSSTINIPLIICGVFYGVLCIFSLVTGLIYFSGKRKLNPLELSDKFVNKLDNEENKNRFARFMGTVTFVVGIFQGITSYGMLIGHNSFFYYFAFGFTIFSICSVLFKLKGKINIFPLLKLIAYVLIIVVLLLTKTKLLFF